MSTRPISRVSGRQSPAESSVRYRSHQQARAAAAPPPDPTAWHTFLCSNCTRPFKIQRIARYCPTCIHVYTKAGIYGIEHTGEASGA